MINLHFTHLRVDAHVKKPGSRGGHIIGYRYGEPIYGTVQHKTSTTHMPSHQEVHEIKKFIGEDPYENAVGINGALRSGTELSTSQKSTVEHLSNVIKRQPTFNASRVFYRGTVDDVYTKRKGSDPYTKPDLAFTSVSTDRDVAEDFATSTSRDGKGFVYEIHTRPGAKALDVSPYQSESMIEQKEYIFDRYKIFKRVGRPVKRGDVTYITLELVN